MEGGDKKPWLTVALIGDVDVGKTLLGANMIYLGGGIDRRQIERLNQETTVKRDLKMRAFLSFDCNLKVF